MSEKLIEALKIAHRVILEQAQGSGCIKGTLWADEHTTLVELLEDALAEARRTPAETVSREATDLPPMTKVPVDKAFEARNTGLDFTAFKAGWWAALAELDYDAICPTPQPVSTGELLTVDDIAHEIRTCVTLAELTGVDHVILDGGMKTAARKILRLFSRPPVTSVAGVPNPNIPWAPKPQFLEPYVKAYIDYIEDLVRVLTERLNAKKQSKWVDGLEASWSELKLSLNPESWTVGDSATYRDFFAHGWCRAVAHLLTRQSAQTSNERLGAVVEAVQWALDHVGNEENDMVRANLETALAALKDGV